MNGPPAWNIKEIAPRYGTPDFDAQAKEIDSLVSAFSHARDELADMLPVDRFVSLAREYGIILTKSMRMHVGAYLAQSLDVQDNVRTTGLEKIEERLGHWMNKVRFFHQWLVHLPSEKAKTYASALGEDHYAFLRMHELARHVLSEAEENIISLKDPYGPSAMVQMYDRICSGFVFEFKGKERSLTDMRNFAMDADRGVRKEASQMIRDRFFVYRTILFDLYRNLCRDFFTEQVTLRKYRSPLDCRITAEDSSHEAVDALMASVRENAALFEEFFLLKAQLLGLPVLAPYDINAPVVLTQEEKIPCSDALRIILEASEDFHPRFAEIIRRLIADGRVDVSYHQNKRGGAYSYPLPDGERSYVFMQYLDKERDLSTLAHELGHAIHATYCTQSVFSFEPTLGICESASTFMEELIFEHRFPSLSRKKQIEALAERMTDTFNTIVRQVYVSLFELEAHELFDKGTSYEVLNRVWTRLQKEQFGKAVSFDKEQISWTYIPHIYHTPFYCYNYAVGNLLSLHALSLLKKDKQKMIVQYESYLSRGGTCSSADTARDLGFDMTSKVSWDGAFAVVRERIALLRTLVDEEFGKEGDAKKVIRQPSLPRSNKA